MGNKVDENALTAVYAEFPHGCPNFREVIEAYEAARAPVSGEYCNGERLLAWLDNPNHKSAHLSFTEGLERQIAYRFEACKKERESETFQSRVKPWMDACFGEVISANKIERNHRFLEEALELVQACGATREDCMMLVDYVYGRPQGDINQEVGGVMITLAAHCLANGVDMHEAGEVELLRIWGKIEQIRRKQASKPDNNSPLPGALSEIESGK